MLYVIHNSEGIIDNRQTDRHTVVKALTLFIPDQNLTKSSGFFYYKRCNNLSHVFLYLRADSVSTDPTGRDGLSEFGVVRLAYIVQRVNSLTRSVLRYNQSIDQSWLQMCALLRNDN